MDVRNWLENTVDRASPDQEDLPNIRRDPNPSGQRKANKRRRASSDSSILASRRLQHPSRIRSHHGSRSEQIAKGITSRSLHNTSPSRERSSIGPEPKLYERQPRHKTRPDRYEPKSRAIRDLVKPKKVRKRSRHKREEGSSAAKVQAFQVKNSSKSKRLTLQPDLHNGLFRHGRAGAPTDERAPGLPDLVFNEMKFLQDTSRKETNPARKEHAQPKEKPRKKANTGQEISTSFQTTKLAHGDRCDTTVQDIEPPKDKGDAASSKYAHQTQPAIVAGDELEGLFLGVGSRGTPNVEARARDRSTTYLSWSDSRATRSISLPHRRDGLRYELMEGKTPARIRSNEHSGSFPDLKRAQKVPPASPFGPVTNRPVQDQGMEMTTAQGVGGSHHVEKAIRGSHRCFSLSRKTTEESPKSQHAQDPANWKIGVPLAKPVDAQEGQYRTSDILDIRKSSTAPPDFGLATSSSQHKACDKENLDPNGTMDALLHTLRFVKTKPDSTKTMVEAEHANEPQGFGRLLSASTDDPEHRHADAHYRSSPTMQMEVNPSFAYVLHTGSFSRLPPHAASMVGGPSLVEHTSIQHDHFQELGIEVGAETVDCDAGRCSPREVTKKSGVSHFHNTAYPIDMEPYETYTSDQWSLKKGVPSTPGHAKYRMFLSSPITADQLAMQDASVINAEEEDEEQGSNEFTSFWRPNRLY